MKRNIRKITLLSICCMVFITACGGGGETATGGTAQSGRLSLGITDATTADYQAVYITINKVQVLKASENEGDDQNWEVVSEPNATYNLLELVNGLIQNLGLVDLEVGRYDQIRLVSGDLPDSSLNIKQEFHPYANYIIQGDHQGGYQYLELTIPSGFQSGFKIIGGFTIEQDQTTDLVLDFNVVKSIVQAGSSGKWLLKPTVNVVDQADSSSITGRVYYFGELDDVPLAGAIVSAQIKTEDVSTEIVTASTITDESGAYTLLTAPGTYSVVAIMPGFKTAVAEVVVNAGVTAGQDFLLEPSQGIGTIYGKVDIENGTEDQAVRINIQEKTAAGTIVEVASATIATGGNYWFDLPAGTYSMVAVFTVNGEEMTMEANEVFEILEGAAVRFDILFGNSEEEDDDSTATDKKKITICHKGRPITISTSALQAHLKHGDSIGDCGQGQDDDPVADGTRNRGKKPGKGKK
ncbi:MAG: DUF4382 domain-containing protein [Thermodesulfobacteriota bacterium]